MLTALTTIITNWIKTASKSTYLKDLSQAFPQRDHDHILFARRSVCNHAKLIGKPQQTCPYTMKPGKKDHQPRF